MIHAIMHNIDSAMVSAKILARSSWSRRLSIATRLVSTLIARIAKARIDNALDNKHFKSSRASLIETIAQKRQRNQRETPAESIY